METNSDVYPKPMLHKLFSWLFTKVSVTVSEMAPKDPVPMGAWLSVESVNAVKALSILNDSYLLQALSEFLFVDVVFQ